jgi:hypothetical protein
MPNLRRFLTATQCAIWDAEAKRNAEAVRLFLPSDILDATKRAKACAVGLPAVEESLRVGEAREVLHALRQGLRTHTMTNRFRLRNCTGQRMLTRGQGILRHINVKIHKAKIRYCYVRNALKCLKGDGPWEKELAVLEDSDVRALNERALPEEEAEQRKAVLDYEEIAEEGGVAAFGVVALGEGRCTLLWIWYSARPEEPTEAELVEGMLIDFRVALYSQELALRVEWCKAYACMRCWHEDVVLVEEEMRRTIEYGHLAGHVWAERADVQAGTVDDELLEGLAAYAHEQEDREATTSNNLTKKWAGIRLKGRTYLARETALGVDIVVPLDDDDVGEEGEEEEEGPPDYEDEGDDEILK